MKPEEENLLNNLKLQWEQNDEISRKSFYCRKIMETGNELLDSEPNKEIALMKINHLCKFYGFDDLNNMLEFYANKP